MATNHMIEMGWTEKCTKNLPTPNNIYQFLAPNMTFISVNIMERMSLQIYKSKPHHLLHSRQLKPFRSLLIIFCALIYAKSISVKSIKMASSEISCHWSNKIKITQDIWRH